MGGTSDLWSLPGLFFSDSVSKCHKLGDCAAAIIQLKYYIVFFYTTFTLKYCGTCTTSSSPRSFETRTRTKSRLNLWTTN